MSDRRVDGAPPDLWLPGECSAAQLQWAVAADKDVSVSREAHWSTHVRSAAGDRQQTRAAPDDGGLERVLEAVYHAGAAAVTASEHFSTAAPAEQAHTAVWEAVAPVNIGSPRRQRVPAQGPPAPAHEPITLPPWGSRAAANPPHRQPQQGASMPGVF